MHADDAAHRTCVWAAYARGPSFRLDMTAPALRTSSCPGHECMPSAVHGPSLHPRYVACPSRVSFLVHGWAVSVSCRGYSKTSCSKLQHEQRALLCCTVICHGQREPAGAAGLKPVSACVHTIHAYSSCCMGVLQHYKAESAVMAGCCRRATRMRACPPLRTATPTYKQTHTRMTCAGWRKPDAPFCGPCPIM